MAERFWIVDLESLVPHHWEFESHQRLWILSCKDAIRSLRNIGGSTLLPVCAWNNVWRGTWGLPLPVKAGKVTIWPLKCQCDLKLNKKCILVFTYCCLSKTQIILIITNSRVNSICVIYQDFHYWTNNLSSLVEIGVDWFYLQVLVIAFITTLLSFPNPYTRMNTSEMIRQLVSRCGPEDTNDLWFVLPYIWWFLWPFSHNILIYGFYDLTS